MLGQIAWNTNSNFVLVAVPLFVMMGEVLLYGGMSERLYTVLSHWLAPIRGGLLHSNIAFSAVFGAISGSSAASAATVGAVSLPSFLARGYNERWVVGSLAAGGTLDILIPPSISMVIYGVLAEESIGRLYLAGFIPGFLLSGVFMLIIYLAARIWPGDCAPRSGAALECAPAWAVVAVSGVRPDVSGAGHHLSGGGNAYGSGGFWGGGGVCAGGHQPADQRADVAGCVAHHGAHLVDDHAHCDFGIFARALPSPFWAFQPNWRPGYGA